MADDVDEKRIPGHPFPLDSHERHYLFDATMCSIHKQAVTARNEAFHDVPESDEVGLLCESAGYGKAATGIELGIEFALGFEPAKDLEIELDVSVDADIDVEGISTAEFQVFAHVMRLDDLGDPLAWHLSDPSEVLDNTVIEHIEAGAENTYGSTRVTDTYYLGGPEGTHGSFVLPAEAMSKGDLYRAGIMIRGIAKSSYVAGGASVDCHPNLGGYDGGVSLNGVYLKWRGDYDVPPIDGTRPNDLDGDGLYMDVNGNGRLDSDDTVTFFEYMDDPEIRDYVEHYDYNGNGRIDYDDVVALQDAI